MNEKKLLTEIYRLLDGELSPSERDELEKYIAAHPEAAKLYSQCEQIKKQFEVLPKVEVDADLKSTVLNRINARQQAQQQEEIRFNVVQQFWQRPAFKASFIFVAGVFIGFLVFSFLNTDFFQFSGNRDKVQGAFSSPRSFQDLKVADVLQFENPQVKAICNVRYSQNWVEIHVDLSSAEMVTSIFEFNTDHFSVYNIQPSMVNSQSNTLVASNSININSIGENKYIIQLYNKTSLSHDISFRLIQNGQQLYASSTTINK